ncbi:MAG: SulP family inorganic anion transporter [Bacteroidetes bacterium]|nr:MAG: SulP family inorganic anion transporter [Bacteroidota bacterium]
MEAKNIPKTFHVCPIKTIGVYLPDTRCLFLQKQYMTGKHPHRLPATGWQGLKENWRNDLIAAISVSMVALPLGLGIAIASDAPPMAGIFSAVIGGLVATLFRGSHLAINGPAAGLITVFLGALASLEDGSGRGLNYVFAAVVMAGGFQVLLGIFKMGRIAEIIPSSVIHGILAAIGVIIFVSQLHVAMGTTSAGANTVEKMLDLFYKLPEINPFIAVISVSGLLLLIFHARISYKLFHFIPAPVWVLFLSVPFVYAFHFFEPHTRSFLGRAYEVGPQYLISVPDNITEAFMWPDFSKIHTFPFWLAVISFTIIASVQTLAMAKAVDKLDPYKRKTDLNKDLIGVGLATMVSAGIGGLPIITVIVRSSVNVHNNAKTKWSNFYHAILLLIFTLLLAPLIQQVPLAALAAILVFTGYKLASPRVFKQIYEKGIEQLLFFGFTLIVTLYTNLLWGILAGMALTLGVHFLLARVPPGIFFQMLFRPGTRLVGKREVGYELKIKGIANFLSILSLKKHLDNIPEQAAVQINFATTRLVDYTVLEHLDDFRRSHEDHGGRVQIVGLEHHVASTNHPLALKNAHIGVPHKLTPREQKLKQIAINHGWRYRYEVEWDFSYLRNFQFFETRPIERKNNVISGKYTPGDILWEISDITFDEGALLATEVYHTTVQVIHYPRPIPLFALEKEGFFDKIFDRVLAFSGRKDIDFQLFPGFSQKFLLKGEDEKEIRDFFTPELIRFLEGEEIYHIESNGEAILLFKYLRLARTDEVERMVDFSKKLLEKIGG